MPLVPGGPRDQQRQPDRARWGCGSTAFVRKPRQVCCCKTAHPQRDGGTGDRQKRTDTALLPALRVAGDHLETCGVAVGGAGRILKREGALPGHGALLPELCDRLVVNPVVALTMDNAHQLARLDPIIEALQAGNRLEDGGRDLSPPAGAPHVHLVGAEPQHALRLKAAGEPPHRVRMQGGARPVDRRSDLQTARRGGSSQNATGQDRSSAGASGHTRSSAPPGLPSNTRPVALPCAPRRRAGCRGLQSAPRLASLGPHTPVQAAQAVLGDRAVDRGHLWERARRTRARAARCLARRRMPLLRGPWRSPSAPQGVSHGALRHCSQPSQGLRGLSARAYGHWKGGPPGGSLVTKRPRAPSPPKGMKKSRQSARRCD